MKRLILFFLCSFLFYTQNVNTFNCAKLGNSIFNGFAAAMAATAFNNFVVHGFKHYQTEQEVKEYKEIYNKIVLPLSCTIGFLYGIYTYNKS